MKRHHKASHRITLVPQLARLRKAAKNAAAFGELVKQAQITDARSQLEVTVCALLAVSYHSPQKHDHKAYVAWMHATLEFEVQNWYANLCIIIIIP